jgi:Flp pilus assembly protein TadB
MRSRFVASDSDLFLVGMDKKVHESQATIHVVFAVVVLMVGLLIGVWVGEANSFVLIAIVTGMGSYYVLTRPQRNIHRKAEGIRRQLELATAVFLDLINVLLAGGAGVETSVIAAANAGDGPGFSVIRLAVMRAQSARVSYWDSLADIGHIAEVPTLIEVAHTVQLAGQHGARIRSSLTSKATALRKRNLAQVEHDEEQRTEKIGLPLVVLFLGFLLLVGYPAFTQTMASF